MFPTKMNPRRTWSEPGGESERVFDMTLPPRFIRRVELLLLALAGFALLAFLAPPPASASSRADSTPPPPITPTPTFDMRRLDKPPVTEPLSQVEEGAVLYWSVCMACHGDRGQGLTDEWRDSFGEDKNCWASKCHASNHPPQGFEFPRIVPPVAGAGALARFVNAQQLYAFNLEFMPRWDPGQLTEEKAWAVTAYLLKLNGALPEGVTLSAANAEFIPVRYAIEPPAKEQPWKLGLAFTLFLSAVVMGAQTIAHRSGTRPNFILHLHPPSIPAAQARFRHTLGAGGLAVFLCLILVVSGMLEMFYYVPSPELAAKTVQEIAFLVPYGGLVRNLHFWSAQALAVVATIHLARVIFTGAYNQPRRFNYLLGLGLLVIILLLDFTGYILRWDEGIRWALIAGTNLLASIPVIGEALVQLISGGMEPGPAILIRYYAWHIFGLTLLGGILMVWHLFRVRRDGGIAAPPTLQRLETLESPPTRIPRRELLRRETIAMLVAGGGLILLSTFLSAPIAQPIDPNLASITEPHAPWFFLWVQELLKIGDPFLWGVAVPLIVLALLAAIPYIFPRLEDTQIGRWFPRSGRAAQLFLMILIFGILALTLLSAVPQP